MKINHIPLLYLLLCMLVIVSVAVPDIYGQERTLLKSTSDSGTVKPKPDPTVIRSRNVTVDVQLLKDSQNQRISIQLFDKESITVIRSQFETTRKNGFIWTGKVENQPRSLVSFSVVGEVVIGNIWTEQGQSYALRYLGGGVHSLRKIDQSKFPPDGEPGRPIIVPGPNEDTCSTDSPSDIDVLVVYSDDARAAAGGTEAMEAEIYDAVTVTNWTYLNSGIIQRLHLVHTQEVNYGEIDVHTARDQLIDDNDSILDYVHGLRNTYGADLVVLIVESNPGDLCGEANVMETVSNSFEKYGFAAVRRDCASSNFTFAHELGHIMSARHEWDIDPIDNAPYHYNHGYYNCAPTGSAKMWRTVMATNASCFSSGSSVRIPYWSDHNDNYLGDALGTNDEPQPTNNRWTLSNTAPTVANFRCGSPTASNMWMKDTWKDTGVEPDPLTAAEDMWKSPYIWIRNTQDPDRLQQHKHQNPGYGLTNWIYVKIHNGSSLSANGKLELYWAHASTGLSWPNDWTLLTSTVPGFYMAHSTHIFEFQWNNLPGAGHYCLLARWVSASEPMAEINDIVSNVRNSNNLVWRNLNIIDMTVTEPDVNPAEMKFIARNSNKEKSTISLAIRTPDSEKEHSFILEGQVVVQFDDYLMKAWKQGGMKGSGFQILNGSEFLVTSLSGASFDNLIFDGLQTGTVKLKFKRLPTTPKRQYMVDAVQYKTGSVPVVTGGVSYQIHTDKIDY